MTPPSPISETNAIAVPLQKALEERYLAYALSTIMGRALPDARDGLKPVHRRILYGMQILKLDPTAAFKKCAKIVGDVMGSFHPHGDQAIYEALVRLAQDFSSRYPLIEGQGNFGNVDGDSAAAYRYTEARLTPIARLLLEGIEEDSVDFRENYAGDQEEPIVLSAAFPNLLANGAQGIAVGMATSIPPHNLGELCEAALYLIAHKEADQADVMRFIKGPDFPTGGVMIDTPAHIAHVYAQGRGPIRLRAKWHKEEGARGAWVVVVTEIPYMVQKSRLLEKIAELLQNKKLPLLADVRDESAQDIRLVLEPRSRAIDPERMMESLFRACDLEIRFPVNMNVLVEGTVPRVVSLAQALRQWLEHRRTVLVRRTRFRLQQIAHRLDVLAGMLIVYLNLDEVIAIIREEETPKPVLKARFGLHDIQVEYILETRLRSLRRLEEMQLKKEHEALEAEQAELTKLLSQEDMQWRAIATQIKNVQKKFGQDTELGKRRTLLAQAPHISQQESLELRIEREPMTVILTEKGWIRALKGHASDVSNLSLKGDDALKFTLATYTTEKIVLLASHGKAYTIEASKLPSGRGHGEPIRLLLDVEEGETFVHMRSTSAFQQALLVAQDGRGFIVDQADLLSSTRKGRLILSLEAPVKVWGMVPLEADVDHVAVIGENRKLLVFPLQQIPQMARGKGVRLQKYKEGRLIDVTLFPLAHGLEWVDTKGEIRRLDEKALKEFLGNRADAGRLAPRSLWEKRGWKRG